MDIFYYWKDIESDLKAGRLGYFRSSRAKLAEFQAATPDNIWVFKTPKGRKGEIQLNQRGLFVSVPLRLACSMTQRIQTQ